MNSRVRIGALAAMLVALAWTGVGCDVFNAHPDCTLEIRWGATVGVEGLEDDTFEVHWCVPDGTWIPCPPEGGVSRCVTGESGDAWIRVTADDGRVQTRAISVPGDGCGPFGPPQPIVMTFAPAV